MLNVMDILFSQGEISYMVALGGSPGRYMRRKLPHVCYPGLDAVEGSCVSSEEQYLWIKGQAYDLTR
jgi:hypothetical protein